MKLLLAACVLSAVVLGACGDGGGAPPSGAEERYFADVQSIQQQANAVVGEIPSLENVGIGDGVDDAELAVLAQFFDVTRAVHEAIAEALRKTSPPGALREAHFTYVEAVSRVRDIALEAQDSLEDQDSLSGALTGLVRAITDVSQACHALQSSADARGIAVNLLCG